MKLVEAIDSISITIKESLEKTGARSVNVYNMDTGSRVFYSIENGKEHISISHPKRYPRWDEIKYARYKLMNPDKMVVQLLPPENNYINVHTNCFHLWTIDEIPVEGF